MDLEYKLERRLERMEEKIAEIKKDMDRIEKNMNEISCKVSFVNGKLETYMELNKWRPSKC